MGNSGKNNSNNSNGKRTFTLKRHKFKLPSEMDSKLTLLVLCLLINLVAHVTYGSESHPDYDLGEQSVNSVKVVVRKCCPFNEYFNVLAGKCEPQTSGGLTSENGNGHFVDQANTTWTWAPPTKFWQFFSLHQPILTFDRESVGMPHCSTTSNEEEDGGIRTVTVGIPTRDEWNLSSSWEWDWEDETNFFFRPNDAILVEVSPNLPYKETHHNPHQFCLDVTESELILRICVCSAQQPCIRKCCPLGQHLKQENETEGGFPTCTPTISDWAEDLPLTSKVKGQAGVALTSEERKELQPRYVFNPPHCNSVLVSSGWSTVDLHHAFIIDPSGQPNLYSRLKGEWEVVSSYSDHCFDRLEGSPAQEVCSGEPEAMLICLDASDQEPAGNADVVVIYVVALVVATVLLLLTAVVLSLFLEKRNIHSWTRLAYILSFFVFFFSILLTHFSDIQPTAHLGACKVIAILIHFTGLTTACWLSIINFDLWWTFNISKAAVPGDTNFSSDVKRFLAYISFSVGLPMLIVSIGLGIESQEPEFVCRATAEGGRLIPPNYAKSRSCAMSEEARPTYWFVPLIILLLTNLVFFLTTTCRMVGHRGQGQGEGQGEDQALTRLASIVGSTSGKQTQSAKAWTNRRGMFVKIFIISGVSWWVEIIQWVVWYVYKNESTAWYWILLDMVHFVQAIALFIIFVCNRDVLRSLQRKFPILKRSRRRGSETEAAGISDKDSKRESKILSEESPEADALLERPIPLLPA